MADASLGTTTPVASSSPVSFNFDNVLLRVVTRDGEPWFVASDVATALDHSDTSMAVRRLDEDERGTSIVCTPSGEQQMLVINESGLYSLILTSRKAEAKKFKKWVTSEVLPSIRKTGSYSTSTISPEQAQHLRELVDLIADAGAQLHPETWSRFHRKFHVNSYLQLPAAKFTEAVEYLKGKMTGGSIAHLLQKHFPNALEYKPEPEPTANLFDIGQGDKVRNQRALMQWGHNGVCTMVPVPNDAFVGNIDQIVHGILKDGFGRAEIAQIFQACAQRMCHGWSPEPIVITVDSPAVIDAPTAITAAPKKAGNPDLKRMTAELRVDLFDRLKLRAATERTTIRTLIERWILGWPTAENSKTHLGK